VLEVKSIFFAACQFWYIIIANGSKLDPTVTSIYFDNEKFGLYSEKAAGNADVSSLRLRWYGPLSAQSQIMFEKKVVTQSEESDEKRFPIESKYVMKFINGEYKMKSPLQSWRSSWERTLQR